MSQNTNLIEYYKNLLIIQYHDKPNAQAHISALVKEAMIYDTAVQVRDCFNVETAVGTQQDIIGKYLGVSRTVSGTAFTRSYYGYSEYGDASPFSFNPMIVYGVAIPDVQFHDYKESQQSLYDLTDEEYRIIQKLAIVRNNSNASVKDIDDIVFALFGAECYFIDRMNMTVVSYMVGEKWSRIFQIARSEGLLPNPAGVGASLIVVPDINNIFSYSLYGGDAPTFAVGYIDYFSNWSLVGNELNIGTTSFPSITSLSSTRIAFVDSTNNKLRAYDFNGTNWTLIGNELSIDATSFVVITALSSTRIAFVDAYNDKLRSYDFNGTNWSLVGNELNIGTTSFPSITSLSSTRIAFVDAYNDKLITYDFDGTNWSLVGNELSITLDSFPSITSLSSTRIAFVDAYNDKLITYDFDGTNWSLVGNELNIGTTSFPSITSLSSTRIAFVDEDLDALKAYDSTRNIEGCMSSYT